MFSQQIDRCFFTTKGLAQRSLNQNSGFTTKAQSSQSSEYFLIKNCFLRTLGASAVNG